MSYRVSSGKEAVDAYVPSQEQPFDQRWLSHLLRRCAFGVTVERLEKFKSKKPREVVDWLLDYDIEQDPFNEQLEQVVGLFTLNSPQAVQDWWFHRMLNTPR